jgi:hypothetical protein
MQKLDRLGWAAGAAVSSYGVRFGIRVKDAALLPGLLAQLPPGAKVVSSPIVSRVYSVVAGSSGGRVRRFNILYRDLQMTVRSPRYEDLLAEVAKDTQLHVAATARSRLFVHAGVVGWKGKAIVIPGRSYSGKTSLVAALVRAGASYYSDEYAVFDGAGRVHPYPVDLNVREAEGGPRRVPPAELGGGLAGTRPLPVGLVLVSRYEAGRTWRPRELSRGQGLLALVRHAVPVRERPAESLATLGRVAAFVPALKGTRGEAAAAAEAVIEHLERRQGGRG